MGPAGAVPPASPAAAALEVEVGGALMSLLKLLVFCEGS